MDHLPIEPVAAPENFVFPRASRVLVFRDGFDRDKDGRSLAHLHEGRQSELVLLEVGLQFTPGSKKAVDRHSEGIVAKQDQGSTGAREAEVVEGTLVAEVAEASNGSAVKSHECQKDPQKHTPHISLRSKGEAKDCFSKNNGLTDVLRGALSMAPRGVQTSVILKSSGRGAGPCENGAHALS